MLQEAEIYNTGFVDSETGVRCDGYVVRPKSGGPWPALILIHEWWGRNAHIEEVARRYAGEGFLVVAPDLYNGVVTTDPGEASRLMSNLSTESGLASLRAVLGTLRQWPEVTSVGVTGFCMGGSFALQLACNARVDAAVPFYGDVPEDTAMIARLDAPLLFIGAGKDEWITLEKMERLEAALKQHGHNGEVKIYAAASHAFFNDTRPDVYSPSDAADAWQVVIQFLKQNLVKG